MMSLKKPSMLDQVIHEFDQALRTVMAIPQVGGRVSPAQQVQQEPLSSQDHHKSAALMRVNHAGEVAAQALYQGQALTSRSIELKHKLRHAQYEEVDHLNWCAERLQQLNSRPSRLSILWYGGALLMGMAAGVAGDRWNLGFLAETERQVEAHLKQHQQRLPQADHASHAILAQMQCDEAQHAAMAEDSGAAALPVVVKRAMALTAAAMKWLAYRV